MDSAVSSPRSLESNSSTWSSRTCISHNEVDKMSTQTLESKIAIGAAPDSTPVAPAETTKTESSSIVANLRTAVLITLATTVIFGLLYPLAVTAIAQVFFPHQANGSL